MAKDCQALAHAHVCVDASSARASSSARAPQFPFLAAPEAGGAGVEEGRRIRGALRDGVREPEGSAAVLSPRRTPCRSSSLSASSSVRP